MDLRNYKKAEKLIARIERLQNMLPDLRPQFAKGLGFIEVYKYQPSKPATYRYNLWDTGGCKTDDAKIMRAGYEAMEKKAKELLEEARKDLDEV